MTEAQKVKRLRSLARRIEKATGNKRKFLQREYDLTRRSLGKMVWVSANARAKVHMGEIVGLPPKVRVDGTYKKNDR